jgi:hypothetical protein
VYVYVLYQVILKVVRIDKIDVARVRIYYLDTVLYGRILPGTLFPTQSCDRAQKLFKINEHVATWKLLFNGMHQDLHYYLYFT